ncbi:MAG TPA: hypothetical protein VH595_12845 [Verrucomicrobiae bacterium]|jgi:hypothetical protein|nr:hypothetical protein [Verrucomicrobiae bacterium]
MERSRGEIILFIIAILGVWISIWAVILVNKWLEGLSVLLTLGALICFAFRDSD